MRRSRRRRHGVVAVLTSAVLAFSMLPTGAVAEELDEAASEQLAEQQTEASEEEAPEGREPEGQSVEETAHVEERSEEDAEAAAESAAEDAEAAAEEEAEAAAESAAEEKAEEEAEEEAGGAGSANPSLMTQGVGDPIASGTCGTCPWTFDADGKLTIGAGTLASNDSNDGAFWPWYEHRGDLTSVVTSGKVVATGSLAYLFGGLDVHSVPAVAYYPNLASIDVSGWDTSQVTSLKSTFAYCSSLSSLDVSSWNTSQVTDMSSTFCGCSSLSSLDVSNWDTSRATYMSHAFSGCSSLSSLDVSNWNTSQVKSLCGMFVGCESLSSLDVSDWDTSQVGDMGGVFKGCSSLSSLDVSDWDTSRVKWLDQTFKGCSSLASLDVSGWDTSQVDSRFAQNYTEDMFSGCTSLASLKVGAGYDIKSADMFPDATASCGKWWSCADKRWYSKNEIVANRSGVADTYLNAAEPGYENDISKASVSIPNQVYSGKALEPTPKVTFDGGSLVRGTDYDVSYKNNVNAGRATVTVTGKGNYTGTASATFTIAKAASRISLAAQTKTYTGKAIAYSGKVTRSGSGGKVTYRYYADAKCTKSATPKAAGTYWVRATLAADANHNGATSAAAKLTVSRASLAKAAIGKIANQAYTGKAVRPSPKVTLGGATLKAGRDYTLSYTNNAKAGTATVTITGKGNYAGTRRVTFKIVAPSVQYRTHVQSYGDQAWRRDGAASGTFGEAKRLEGIWVKLQTKPVKGSIQYRTHVQTYGWQAWRGEGKMSGTSGEAKRLEAIQIRLTGNMVKAYDVYYRVHAQRIGWMGWAKNGAQAGTAGFSYRLEGIQILLLPKGSKAPSANYGGYRQATSQPFRKA